MSKIILECFEGDPEADVVLQRLSDQLKDKHKLSTQTFLELLDRFESLRLDLEAVMVEQRGSEPQGKYTQKCKCIKCPKEHKPSHLHELVDHPIPHGTVS